MQTIDQSGAINYTVKPINFIALVAWSISSNTLTITDNTSYPSGDGRDSLNITIWDSKGAKVEKHIPTAGGNSGTIDVSSLDKANGLVGIATLSSQKGIHKDGTAFGINTVATAGSFTMKY